MRSLFYSQWLQPQQQHNSIHSINSKNQVVMAPLSNTVVFSPWQYGTGQKTR